MEWTGACERASVRAYCVRVGGGQVAGDLGR